MWPGAGALLHGQGMQDEAPLATPGATPLDEAPEQKLQGMIPEVGAGEQLPEGCMLQAVVGTAQALHLLRHHQLKRQR